MIEELFTKWQVSFVKTLVPHSIIELTNVDEIIDYLMCMGKSIKLYPSVNGVPLTGLFSVREILEENDYEINKRCLDHGYLIIGYGPNGDFLCVNISNGLVGYAFHDDLWEETYTDFQDIYIELPFSIEKFLEQALENEEYIYDGYKAEEFMENLNVKR